MSGASSSVLTQIQREVLKRVAEGATRIEIAKERGVNAKTVEYHCMAVMKRLDIYDVARLTHWAIANKLVELMYVPAQECLATITPVPVSNVTEQEHQTLKFTPRRV